MNQKKLSVKARYCINTTVVLAIILATYFVMIGQSLSNYVVAIISLSGINVILAISLNVATGYLGQLPLGHAGFMAVGAYTAGIFLKKTPMADLISEGDKLAQLPYIILALALGGVCAGLVGILIGIPALRLRGDYLAIITLGFGEIIRVILQNIDSVVGFELTGGTSGLKRIPKFTDITIVVVCVVITITVIYMVMTSRQGRAILAIRENEIAAESCGINTTRYKVTAFALSAFFAGVAGALYAGYVGLLQPTTFGFMKSIEILVMVVLGGMGSMVGSLISATTLTAVPQILLAFDKYRMVVYSILLILVMIFRPKGLFGTWEFSLTRIIERILNGKPQTIAKEEESA
ncbi:MAG: branched-chain amino acid ABC transporter permease [Eubacteriales bacterium]